MLGLVRQIGWRQQNDDILVHETCFCTIAMHCCSLELLILCYAHSLVKIIIQGGAEVTSHSMIDERVWSKGGMILTGENWSIGRKTLYSVGGRWMDGYGAMVEWYWQGKTEVLGEKHYTAWVVDVWMSMEQWRNDTDRGKLKCWEKNIIQCGW